LTSLGRATAPMKEFSQSLTDLDFVQNPYLAYDRARALGPVVFWRDMGMVAAFDHATVSALLRDRRLGRTPLEPRPAPDHLAAFRALESDSLLELEPPRHTRLRALVLRAFTSRSVTRLRPGIEAITAELVAALPRDAPFDLIPSFCQPLPVRVIAQLLGVPEEMAPELLAWSRDMVAMYQTGVTEDVEKSAGRAAADFTAFMRDFIDARRSDPRDDLITALISAEEDGAKLTTDEMISTAILLLNAGHEATVHSLGNATRVLIELGVMPRGDGVPALVEEVLRFEAPLHVFTRFVYQAVDLPGGGTLKPGEEVALVLGAANRDPAVYDDPDIFRPERSPNPQTSFGGGLHFCVGAALARAEMQVALPALFAALPSLDLAEAPHYANSYHFHKHDRLMVRG